MISCIFKKENKKYLKQFEYFEDDGQSNGSKYFFGAWPRQKERDPKVF